MTTTFRPMDISKKFLSKEKLDCSLLCAEPFVSFRRHEKKRKERLEKEYKSKAVRLKAAFKYKSRHTSLPHTLTNKIQHIHYDAQYIFAKKLHLRKIISKLLLILCIETEQFGK